MQNLHYPSFFLVPHLSLRLGQRFKICNFCFCSKYSEYVVHGLRSKKKKVYFFYVKRVLRLFQLLVHPLTWLRKARWTSSMCMRTFQQGCSTRHLVQEKLREKKTMGSLSLIVCLWWKRCSRLSLWSSSPGFTVTSVTKMSNSNTELQECDVTSEVQAALVLIWLWGLSCLQTGQWFWVDWAGRDCSPAASQNWTAVHLCFWLPQEKQAKRGITRNWADVPLCWLSQITYWKSLFFFLSCRTICYVIKWVSTTWCLMNCKTRWDLDL